MRKTRTKNKNESFYVATGIAYKDTNKQGIYGFRLYDLDYDDYTIFTLNGIKHIIEKYPNGIENIKIHDGYIGLLYVSSNNYSSYTKKGELISKGNKIFFRRYNINKYMIINEDGALEFTDIRGIKDWVQSEVLLYKDKDKLLALLKNDIAFFNDKYDKFTRKNELLTITGNNYLHTRIKTLTIYDKNLLEVYGIKNDVVIPNGIVRIPSEVEIVSLNINDREDIKVIDLKAAKELKKVALEIEKCNIKILFPEYGIPEVRIKLNGGIYEFQNLEHVQLVTLEMNNVVLANKKLSLNFYGKNDFRSISLYRVAGLKELEVKSNITFSESYFRISYCDDLEYIDCSNLNINNLSTNLVTNCNKLKRYKVRLDNGYFYGVCNWCKSLEELEIYGTAIEISQTSISFNTPMLRKLRIDVNIQRLTQYPCFCGGNYVIEELINNSNVSNDKLFSSEYFRVCKIYNSNEKLKMITRSAMLDPIYKDDEIIGFKMLKSLYLDMPNTVKNEFTEKLRNGILDIPKEILEVSNRVFINQNKITKVILHGPIKIGNSTFGNCVGLRHIENSEFIQELGVNAFACCEKLTEFKCGDNLKKISQGAFMWCTSLEKLYIGKNVKELEKYSLFGCLLLKLSGNTNFKFDDLSVLNKNYIFKLTNSEIGEVAAAISPSTSVTISEIVHFEEMIVLSRITNNNACRARVIELKRTQKEYENLWKLTNAWIEYKNGRENNIKITMSKSTKDALDFINSKRNYMYLVMAKQMNNILKKLKTDSNMRDILKSIEMLE